MKTKKNFWINETVDELLFKGLTTMVEYLLIPKVSYFISDTPFISFN